MQPSITGLFSIQVGYTVMQFITNLMVRYININYQQMQPSITGLFSIQVGYIMQFAGIHLHYSQINDHHRFSSLKFKIDSTKKLELLPPKRRYIMIKQSRLTSWFPWSINSNFNCFIISCHLWWISTNGDSQCKRFTQRINDEKKSFVIF